MTFRSDPAQTAQRVVELTAYMGANVLGPDGFCCANEDVCTTSVLRDGRTNLLRPGRSFFRGQLSHVGAHYDMSENGLPWRVLVLGMETGHERENVTLPQRREEQQPVILTPPRSARPT